MEKLASGHTCRGTVHVHAILATLRRSLECTHIECGTSEKEIMHSWSKPKWASSGPKKQGLAIYRCTRFHNRTNTASRCLHYVHPPGYTTARIPMTSHMKKDLLTQLMAKQSASSYFTVSKQHKYMWLTRCSQQLASTGLNPGQQMVCHTTVLQVHFKIVSVECEMKSYKWPWFNPLNLGYVSCGIP